MWSLKPPIFTTQRLSTKQTALDRCPCDWNTDLCRYDIPWNRKSVIFCHSNVSSSFNIWHSIVEEKDFTAIYCNKVVPNRNVQHYDKAINLSITQTMLNKCILLLNFSLFLLTLTPNKHLTIRSWKKKLHIRNWCPKLKQEFGLTPVATLVLYVEEKSAKKTPFHDIDLIVRGSKLSILS